MEHQAKLHMHKCGGFRSWRYYIVFLLPQKGHYQSWKKTSQWTAVWGIKPGHLQKKKASIEVADLSHILQTEHLQTLQGQKMGKCVLVNVGQFILGQVPMRKRRNWLLWTENHDGCMQYQGVTWYHLLHSTREDEIQPTKTNLQIPQKKNCSPVKGRTFFNLADAIVVQIAGSEIKKI